MRKKEVELELLTGINMLLMIEKGIEGGIYHAIHRHAKENTKYMKDYDKDNESSYLIYLDASNLYGWAISRKLHIDGSAWKIDMSKFNKEFTKNYDKDSDIGYILEVDVEYPENLHDLHRDLEFLPGKMKIEKRNKLVCSLYDKNDYIAHIRTLKQALNCWLVFKTIIK